MTCGIQIVKYQVFHVIVMQVTIRWCVAKPIQITL